MTQFQQRSPDLILFSGDAVTLGIGQLSGRSSSTAPSRCSRAPVISAHGNHEGKLASTTTAFPMPGVEENFSFDFGHVHLTVANDTPEDPGGLRAPRATSLRGGL